MKPILVYVTTADEKDAEMIGATLIKQQLASCVNILPGMHSQYIWKGKFQHDKECMMIIKTFDTKYKKLEKTVKKLHCYENPCIIAVPISKISKEYLDWSMKVIR
ncbi:divalent-cation tolerance protein CutA [Candidatus Woesearchaeota archaeon]|nr:divalent-cation tolerance protein CutA [Candidatus Woesearchaeota archaeon]